MTTQLEQHLQECSEITHRIREGFAPEPLPDDLLDKLPPMTKAVVPSECQPEPAPVPVEKVRDYVAKNMQRQTMYVAMVQHLATVQRVNASDLTRDGWITLNMAMDFLSAMADLGIVKARGYCDVVSRGGGKRRRLTVYCDVAHRIPGTIPQRRAA